MRTQRSAALLLALLFASLAAPPSRARAHGLIGHVHVTGWAIDHLPPGELRDLFDDPEVRAAALMGAAFPDTGYAVLDEELQATARTYGESAHWEPFIQSFVVRIRERYAPPYDTHEEHLVIAFMMGAASHGLQDELFDSTFLHECEQRDGAGQEATDPGTDGFLVVDGYQWMYPGEFVPWEDLLAIYDTIDPAIDQPLIENGIRIVKSAYLNDVIGPAVARSMAERYRDVIPWAAAHYVDPEVAGSLRAEVEPTAAHMQALWERIHGREREEDLVVHAWPDPPRRLREGESESVASWVTLVLGRGVEPDSATGTFTDSEGVAHPFELAGTRWGGTTRLLRFQPRADLTPGAFYEVTLQPGATLVDGTTTTLAHTHRFQVECDDATLCPPVEVEDPSIDPPPPPPPMDAGPPDAGPAPAPAASGGGCAVGATRHGAPWLAALAMLALVARRRRARW